MRVRSGYPGRAPAPIGEMGRTVLIHAAPPHPTRQAHGRHTGPVESPDRRPPHPAANTISRCSATASGDARHCRCRGATPDTPRSAHRARGPGSSCGALAAHGAWHSSIPPAPPHSRDARATITHSGHTFTLDSALKPLSHPPETLIHSHSTHPLCLSYSLTRIHSLSLTLTQTHPLTHSHASTHSLTRIHSLSLTGGACRCAPHWESLKGSLEIVID
jgi:hypothetical protein